MAHMKTMILAALLGAMLIGTGCVRTVDDRKTAGVPWGKDKMEGRYERSVNQVFDAAKAVVKDNGVLSNESTIYSQTNSTRTLEGKVNQRNVWIRVQEVDAQITSVVVQTRTSGGGSDVYLAHELEKQIALKLK